MSSASSFQPAMHRVAALTAAAALLPITVGALVTTMNWGMAFADWPTSDGQNMFLYPWLSDLRNHPGKFTEHGHRLGGAFIGFCSIALAWVAWKGEPRAAVRRLAYAILGCVVLQGLLGGNRVLRDDPRMALVHGAFASVVFTLMCLLTLVTSRRWHSAELFLLRRDHGVPAEGDSAELVPDSFRPYLVAAPFVVMAQYLIGGSIRHLGLGLHEHLAGAVVVAAVGGLSAFAARWSSSAIVRRLGGLLALALCLQLLLGAGAWITRFGFAAVGYVAVHQSPAQMIFRTAHTVVGMFVLASSSLLAFCVLAGERARAATAVSNSRATRPPAALAKGGV